MLKKLYLKNYRNYSELELKIDKPVNLFVGRNGQGKTNLLEAIFFISMLRSFRTQQIRDLKSIGRQGFIIGAEIDNSNGWSEYIEINYLDNKRKLMIDAKPIPRASEFIKKIKTVVFSPDDIAIVNGNSSNRRRFFDFLISLLEPDYLAAMQNYLIALKSRNILLKKHSHDYEVLKAYEKILAREGAMISVFRNEYTRILTEIMKKLLANFFNEQIFFKINYHPVQLEFSEDKILKRFDYEREKDIKRGFSSFGPQTDEFDILFNGKIMRNYASNGQCRLIALCLKMASVEILAARENSKSIVVLVDDVMGDLDPVIKKSFYRIIENAGQIFFTFTEIPNDEYFKNAGIYDIIDGTVEERK